MAGSASWSLAPDDAQRLERDLQQLLDESGARCALLIERTGQLVALVGERPDFDPVAFASLAAADFAANLELAALVGEDEFAVLFHQGELHSLLLAEVGGRAIIVVRFDARAPLGMVRLRVRQAVPRLAAALSAARTAGAGAAAGMEAGWAAEAEGEIDRVLGGG